MSLNVQHDYGSNGNQKIHLCLQVLLLTDYKIDVHGILLVADLARVVGYGLPINLYSLCCMIKEFILFFYSLLYLFKVYFILMDKTDLKVLNVLMWNFILKYFIINYLIKSYLFLRIFVIVIGILASSMLQNILKSYGR